VPALALERVPDNALVLMRTGGQSLADAHEVRFLRLVENAGSPLEALFLAALMNDFAMSSVQVHWLAAQGIDLLLHDGVPDFCVMMQASVGRYRADFGIIDARGSMPKKYVIECDGHDFHERTKDQAKRDRRRDRWMMRNDISVMRFTGAEIFDCPMTCSGEALDAMGVF